MGSVMATATRRRCGVCRERGHNASAHTRTDRAAAQRAKALAATEDHLSGVLATWRGLCPRCDLEVSETRVVKTSSGAWIHVSCASGSDDR